MTVNNILGGTMFAIFNKLKDKFKKIIEWKQYQY